MRLHTGDPCLYGAIQEQMDALDARGVDYEVVPGVSSFCGAAAALRQEYTLPGISQSVVITRLSGRTPMPAGEGMRTMAESGSTMVIFLSSGMLAELSAELLAAGRSSDEPAALVCKATWPEERVVRCTVGTLADAGAREAIDRTALVVVGRVLGARGGFSHNGAQAESYERSKLYDPSFATGYRKASS